MNCVCSTFTKNRMTQWDLTELAAPLPMIWQNADCAHIQIPNAGWHECSSFVSERTFWTEASSYVCHVFCPNKKSRCSTCLFSCNNLTCHLWWQQTEEVYSHSIQNNLMLKAAPVSSSYLSHSICQAVHKARLYAVAYFRHILDESCRTKLNGEQNPLHRYNLHFQMNHQVNQQLSPECNQQWGCVAAPMGVQCFTAAKEYNTSSEPHSDINWALP